MTIVFLFYIIFKIFVQVQLSAFPPPTIAIPTSLPTVPSPLPSGYCQIALNFNVSGYFCLLFSFVDQVSVKGEIIWYLSLTAWLISLSIMLSSSIHALAKGISSSQIKKKEYNTVVLIKVTMQYIRSPVFIHFIAGSLYPLMNIFTFSPPSSS